MRIPDQCDGLDDLRALARERWGQVTAFRLGILVGEVERTGVRCPYTTPRGQRAYHEGMRHALTHRKASE